MLVSSLLLLFAPSRFSYACLRANANLLRSGISRQARSCSTYTVSDTSDAIADPGNEKGTKNTREFPTPRVVYFTGRRCTHTSMCIGTSTFETRLHVSRVSRPSPPVGVGGKAGGAHVHKTPGLATLGSVTFCKNKGRRAFANFTRDSWTAPPKELVHPVVHS